MSWRQRIQMLRFRLALQLMSPEERQLTSFLWAQWYDAGQQVEEIIGQAVQAFVEEHGAITFGPTI